MTARLLQFPPRPAPVARDCECCGQRPAIIVVAVLDGTVRLCGACADDAAEFVTPSGGAA